MRWGKKQSVGCLAALVALVGVAATAAGSASVRDGYFRPPCRTGTVALGHSPSRILFTVHCVRRHGHRFGFTIGRGDRRGKHVTISSFSLKPSTRGPGAVYRRGRCQRGRQLVACDAYADGRVTLRGWLSVPRIWRCRSEITLVQAVPSRCNPNKGQVCPAVLVTNTIFSGLPRGC